MEPQIQIVKVARDDELYQALAVREVVFIEEHGSPDALERDSEDDIAYRLLALVEKHAVGTGRLVEASAPAGASGTWGKVGSMAVLTTHRRRGIGTRLLNELETEARRRGYAGLRLSAQLSWKDFYTRHGYAPAGEPFDEAGVPHMEMTKLLA